MNETSKKILLIVVAVLALVGAGFGAKKLFGGDQQQVVQQLPADPNFKSEKELALEAQKQGTQPDVSRERDLSGAIGGQG